MTKLISKLVILDTIEVTLSITMPLKSWKELENRLGEKHRSKDLQELYIGIRDVFIHTQKHFYIEKDESS